MTDAYLDWLYSTQMFGFKLGLENPRRLLRQFKATPAPGVKVMHVAGTNGKGSTCAMAESIARAMGYKTGLFTSPHLVEFGERIRVNGTMIPLETLHLLIDEIRTLVSSWENHPTFFELTLAIALKYFKQQQVEIIFLETGLGGRLDATNAVPKDIAVLTPIGMDHMQYLGNSLAEIAAEKAGIIAEGKPVISAAQEPEALDSIEQIADERRAPLTLVESPLLAYGIALEGEHQRYNAALATEALHALGLSLRTDAVAHGLQTVQWPGRFERIGDQFILDGAHNTHATPTLLKTWHEAYNNQKTSVVFSAVADKDISHVLADIVTLTDDIHFTSMSSPRAMAPEDIAKLVPTTYTGKITLHHNIQNALKEAQTSAQKKGLPALITGSLYLLGEVKGILENSPTRATRQ